MTLMIATSLLFLGTMDEIMVPKGSVEDAAYSISRQLEKPVVIGFFGKIDTEFKVSFDKKLLNPEYRSLEKVAGKLGARAWRKGDHYAIARWSFPRPYPTGSSRMGIPESVGLSRLVIKEDQVRILENDKQVIHSGVLMQVGEVVDQCEGVDVHWFLRDFFLAMGFETVKKESFAEIIAQATCGKLVKKRDGTLLIDVDRSRFRTMWENQFVPWTQSDDIDLVERGKISLELIRSLTPKEIETLLSKNGAFLSKFFDPGSDLFNRAKERVDYNINLKVDGDPERSDVYRQHYSQVRWDRPVKATISAVNNARIVLPTSDPKVWVTL